MKTVSRVFLTLFAVTSLMGCRHRLAEQPLTPQQRQWAEQMDGWNWKWRLPYHAPVRSVRQRSNDSISIPPRQVTPSPELMKPVLSDEDMGDSLELPPATDLPPVMTDEEVVLVPMDTVPTGLPATPAGQTHTVTQGDSLSKIAIRYYGKASLWRRVYDANRGTIDSPDKLKVGSILTIPPAE